MFKVKQPTKKQGKKPLAVLCQRKFLSGPPNRTEKKPPAEKLEKAA